MATEVRLPELGEGIEDVTINRWMVHEGDAIDAGDVLVEVATDKVDTEVPAPVGGVVLKLNYSEGELVDVDAVIAIIGQAGEEIDAGIDGGVGGEAAQGRGLDGREEAESAPASGLSATEAGVKATPVARRVAAEKRVSLDTVTGTGSGGQITKSDVLAYVEEQKGASSADAAPGLPDEYADVAPLSVRRAAADYNVDLRDVAAGRPLSALTRHDVLGYVAERKGIDHLSTQPSYPRPVDVRPAQPTAPTAAPQPSTVTPARPTPQPTPAREIGPGEEFVPHSRMRQIIARNMVQSAFTAPHVTTVHSVDMSAVTAHYQAHKAVFAREGVRLTLTAYIIAALVEGLKATPAANAEWTDDGLIVKRYYNIGMATALPPDEYGVGGLIVPVIQNVGDLNLRGIARQVDELAQKARTNQLSPSDLQGGTFTLTNYGTSGSKFQTPVIFPPQVAILGTGAIEKRPVVVSDSKPYEASVGDSLAFRPLMDIALSYDHRVLDGASADAFCGAVKRALEQWESST